MKSLLYSILLSFSLFLALTIAIDQRTEGENFNPHLGSDLVEAKGFPLAFCSTDKRIIHSANENRFQIAWPALVLNLVFWYLLGAFVGSMILIYKKSRKSKERMQEL